MIIRKLINHLVHSLKKDARGLSALSFFIMGLSLAACQ
jgi:hypothetical protein